MRQLEHACRQTNHSQEEEKEEGVRDVIIGEGGACL